MSAALIAAGDTATTPAILTLLIQPIQLLLALYEMVMLLLLLTILVLLHVRFLLYFC